MSSLSAAAADFASGIYFGTTDPSATSDSLPPQGIVMPYTEGMRGFACEHELMTRLEVVRRLAQLKGLRHSVENPLATLHAPVYYVPSDTLVGLDRAQALGIHNRDHLFGGVVPQAFVATKAITHPLVEKGARAPEGWGTEFAERVGDAVLKGFTAFALADAQRAGRLLLGDGPVRVKTVRETGGRGQTVVRNADELDACLAGYESAALEQDGVVLEENLTDVITLSVGQVTVAGMVASYHGEQYLTRNREGGLAYGGSRLTVVRGDFNALLALPLADDVRMGVEQAMTYDAAAIACFPGFFASRINYDVVQGIDARGHWRSGVLEQSWRAGGATGAEIAALEAFRSDPQRELVTAACVEVHGPCELPAGAVVYFQGDDPATGPLTKYTLVEPHAHAS
ncbi:MAG: DUF3182 family protein [Burkholderiaceae bacterium]|nr:DUF3182 family protein [Burkholderiaceae bacterium]